MTRLTQPVTDSDHVWGALDAELVIVEYGDYERLEAAPRRGG
jgi:hypothetical protein